MSNPAGRFEEFLSRHDAGVAVVDRFAGFAVDVALPIDWTPVDTFEATGGARAWGWPNDPCRKAFCANAVLILQRFDKTLDEETIFTLTCQRQRDSVPGCRELHRELGSAVEGPGVAGTLVLDIDHDIGPLYSVTHVRIAAGDHETLVAQLTATALEDSPLDLRHIRLTLLTDLAPETPATVRYHGSQAGSGAAAGS